MSAVVFISNSATAAFPSVFDEGNQNRHCGHRQQE